MFVYILIGTPIVPLRRPGDFVWDDVRDGDDEAAPSSACLPSLSS